MPTNYYKPICKQSFKISWLFVAKNSDMEGQTLKQREKTDRRE
jgi:hypothetical protein